MSSFSHNGKRYEVSAMSAFQAEMRIAYMTQVFQLLKKHFELENMADLPRSQDNLVSYFVDWHLCTRIDNLKTNLVTFDDVDTLLAFFETIGSDDELANKWLTAYQEANHKQSDDAIEKNVVAPVSE